MLRATCPHCGEVVMASFLAQHIEFVHPVKKTPGLEEPPRFKWFKPKTERRSPDLSQATPRRRRQVFAIVGGFTTYTRLRTGRGKRRPAVPRGLMHKVSGVAPYRFTHFVQGGLPSLGKRRR